MPMLFRGGKSFGAKYVELEIVLFFLRIKKTQAIDNSILLI
jgi:hypothetical protein